MESLLTTYEEKIEIGRAKRSELRKRLKKARHLYSQTCRAVSIAIRALKTFSGLAIG